ncbi:MAG: hypothetical protein R3C03_01600 [Pirellulaceae bacterium]
MSSKLFAYSLVPLFALLIPFLNSVNSLQTTGAASSIETLKEERIAILQERVATVEKAIAANQSSNESLWLAKLDVLHARLEDAADVAKRRIVLNEMLSVYDEMLPVMELQSSKRAAFNESSAHDAGSSTLERQLAFLKHKADRVHVQIMLAELD